MKKMQFEEIGNQSKFGKFIQGVLRGFVPASIFVSIIGGVVYMLDNRISVVTSQEAVKLLNISNTLTMGCSIIMSLIAIWFATKKRFIFTIGFVMGAVIGIYLTWIVVIILWDATFSWV